jgi:hypothetical protein
MRHVVQTLFDFSLGMLQPPFDLAPFRFGNTRRGIFISRPPKPWYAVPS